MREIRVKNTLWSVPHRLENWCTQPEDQHLLTLHLTLTDGSTVDYLYNVGKKVRYITPTWDELWSYTDVRTNTMVVTIWDCDPGDDPDKPDDPINLGDPDDPHEPDLPDVPGKDDSNKARIGVDVNFYNMV